MDRTNRMRDVKMPPLTEINEDGAQNLMEAVYMQAAKDYIAAWREIIRHPDSWVAKETMLECEAFLGKETTESLRRSWAKEIAQGKMPYHRRKF